MLPFTRRDALRHTANGFGMLGLAGVLAADADGRDQPGRSPGPLTAKPGHFPAKAKRVIFLFMNGGPSHVDTFDPKPGLTAADGKDAPAGAGRKGKLMKSPCAFSRAGTSRIEDSELFPEVAKHIDDICVLRGM